MHPPSPTSHDGRWVSSPGNRGRTIERAFDVLRCVEGRRAPMRLSEISRSTGLHIATVQRITGILVRLGFLSSTEDGYLLGAEFLAGAHSFVMQDPLLNYAKPILTELCHSTGLTASVYVRSGLERILIARVEAPEPMRYQFPLGRRLELDVGAGKVLLAFAPEELLEEYLEAYDGRRLANGSWQSPERLRSEIAVITQTGSHIGLSERHVGTVSAATAIRSTRGKMLGALNVVSDVRQTSEAEIEQFVPDVVRAAEFIGAHF